MTDTLTLVVILAQIVIQLGAAYFAYRLVKITGVFLAWKLIIIALVLMSVKRILDLLLALGMITSSIGVPIYRLWVPLIISVLLIVGMYMLVTSFLKQSKRKVEN